MSIFILILFCFSCSTTKSEPEIKDDNKVENNNNVQKNLFIEEAEPFYPITNPGRDV